MRYFFVGIVATITFVLTTPFAWAQSKQNIPENISVEAKYCLIASMNRMYGTPKSFNYVLQSEDSNVQIYTGNVILDYKLMKLKYEFKCTVRKGSRGDVDRYTFVSNTDYANLIE